MRAKRSKKYRKLMHQYELAFGFREPYQVLGMCTSFPRRHVAKEQLFLTYSVICIVDSNLLRAVHSFKMDLIPALERTLQGQVKPCTFCVTYLHIRLHELTSPAVLTKCSLASIMAGQPTNPRTNNPIRPDFLPPPTTLPLRHCSHNEDSTPIDETSCLLSLLSPLSDVKRNKEHYILATADPPAPKSKSATQQETGKKRKRDADDGLQALKRAQALRRGARSIPGVPIVYVKRSVMILEPMSAPSEGIREGVEEDKLRTGLTDQSVQKSGGPDSGEKKKKKREPKKAKGPNPLSVKKPKKRVEQKATAKRERPRDEAEKRDSEKDAEDGEAAPKPKRRRRHHKGAKQGDSGGDETEVIATAPIEATDQ